MILFWHQTHIIWRKELYNYFWSPIAYIILPMFLLIAGYFFSFSLFYLQVATMSNAFHNMGILLLLLGPVITMRLLSEEQQSGSLELMFTLPVRLSALLLGKYLASLTMLGLALTGSVVFVVPLLLYGEPDLGPIAAGYLGTFLLGAVYMAVGLFVSALSRNQIVAAIGTTGILILLWFASYLDNFQVVSLFGVSFGFVSTAFHQGEFVRGIIPVASLVYLLSLSALFFGLSWLSLVRRRYLI